MAELKNRRHECFVQEYLLDLNQTQAYLRAGYKVKDAETAGTMASRLMANAKVRARVEELMAERSRRTGVNADRVVRELARLAFVNAPDVIDIASATIREDATKEDTAAIQSVKVKTVNGEEFDSIEREIKLTDKVKALELLGKHLGMFTDKLQVAGGLGVTIHDDIPE